MPKAKNDTNIQKRGNHKIKLDTRTKQILAALMLMVVVSFAYFMPRTIASEPVYQILSDYQNDPNGGNGYLRIYTFNPAEQKLYVKTYSPILDQYKTGSQSEFELSFTLNSSIPFTVIALPDTQFYSKLYPETFTAQTEWIAENREALNIIFVCHLGDLVDNQYSFIEYSRASTSMGILSQNNIPFNIAVGNHDYTKTDDYSSSFYAMFFNSIHNIPSTQMFNEQNLNSYYLTTVGENKLLFLTLQYQAPDLVLTWANNIISLHPDYQVILTTHNYMNGMLRSEYGEHLYQSLVVPNSSQIHLVLCGHIPTEGFLSYSLITQNECLRIDRI